MTSPEPGGRRFGMKSKILYVVCLAYFIAGLQVYNIQVPTLEVIRQADPSIVAHTNMFTLHQIGLIFMLGSIVAFFLGLRKKLTAAYSLMIFLLTWWALLYVVSWVQTGYWQSIYGLVNYGLTATLLILCSKIVEIPSGATESQNTPLPLAGLDLRIADLEREEPK